MTLIKSFLPISAPDAEMLILGSMPGEASLQANQYYAHRSNAFWRIMGELVGAEPALPYSTRLEKLKAAKIALWDVMAACERSGSLDADIIKSSIKANDFRSFFTNHPHIKQIFFNGSTAENSFKRFVLPQLETKTFMLHRLPSTSPAHAAMKYSDKLAAWTRILEASANK